MPSQRWAKRFFNMKAGISLGWFTLAQKARDLKFKVCCKEEMFLLEY